MPNCSVIHDASNRGVSVRGIAREMGISRNTVRKYLAAEGTYLVGLSPALDTPAWCTRSRVPGHTLRNCG